MKAIDDINGYLDVWEWRRGDRVIERHQVPLLNRLAGNRRESV